MTQTNLLVHLSILIAMALGGIGSVQGAEPETPIKILLHPAAQPVPALKYRLLPGRLDQKPGNAAVHYGKVTAEEQRFFGNREIWEDIIRWQEAPLEELRNGHVNLPTRDGIEDSIRRGAHCHDCDWQLPIGDVPFFGMLLPEVQQIRQFGRILAARARIQMANGEFDDSIETLQAGYALGRHVAKGETLVNGLVGIAICQIMSQQVLELIQQPEAPNLYWALTMLPCPLIEMRDAIDVEANSVELSFPELRDLSGAKYTADEWRGLFRRFARGVVEQISDADSPPPPSPEKLDELCEQKFPAAKQVLVESGLKANEVEAMPIYQVALLYSLLTYHELVDDAIKYYYLPYPQAIAGIDAVIERARREQREIIPLAERLLPGLRTVRSATTRNDRQIAVLRVLEALRIYGTHHQGQLPRQLADITEVPVPDDPVTGRSFDYRLEGDKALLEGPTFREIALNYEITMVRP